VSTQDRIDDILDLMERVIKKKGSKDVADGHCTFGIEYPAILGRDAFEPMYFASIDLHGPHFFTDKTMEGVLKRVQQHIKRTHSIK